ncbi:hypothetical protein V8E51_005410 [Hyaloscypha variabilis]
MMDPITALGVAGNVIQFLELGVKAVSKAREIQHSSNGALVEHIEIGVLTEDISAVAVKLAASAGAATGNDRLDCICEQCTIVAKELSEALKEMKADGKKSRIKSARKALKAMWGKKRVEDMKRRLEGYRDEIQFHVLVDLKCHIDVTSTEQSARFDSLDGHAKMLFEVLSENHYSLRDTMTSESAKSAERHLQTKTTILLKQEEIQAEFISAISSLEDQSRSASEAILENTGSLYHSVLVESARADERHEQTTSTIVSTQKEAHMDVKQALESMDAALRSEHDTLRREFGEVMQAMLKLRQEILRENNKLKELVIQAIGARSEKERDSVQEQSNAVTFVLYNLMTLYQSLQKIILGLQAQLKILLTSTNFSGLWGSQPLKPSLEPGDLVERCMLDAVTNKPSDIMNSISHVKAYISANKQHYGMLSGHVERMWDSKWTGAVTIEYKSVEENSGINPEVWTFASKEMCLLLGILDLDMATPDFAQIGDQSCLLHDHEFRTVHLLKSLVIITTMLTHYLGPAGASDIIANALSRTRPPFSQSLPANVVNAPPDYMAPEAWPGIDNEADRWAEGIWDVTTGRLGLAVIYKRRLRRLRQVTIWSTAGKIAGFKKRAETILKSRLQKWGAEKGMTLVSSTDGPQKFFEWFVTGDGASNPYFYFEVGTTEASRAHGAVLYAMVEFLIQFGFCLTTPVIEVGKSGVRARVGRVILGEGVKSQRARERNNLI